MKKSKPIDFGGVLRFPSKGKQRERLLWLKKVVKREVDFWKGHGMTEERSKDYTIEFTAFIVEVEILKELDEIRAARNKPRNEGRDIRAQLHMRLARECIERANPSDFKIAQEQWNLLLTPKQKREFGKLSRSMYYRALHWRPW